MTKRRLILLSSGVLVVLLLVGLVGVSVASAQETVSDPQPPVPFDQPGCGRGGFRRGVFGRVGGGSWTMFDTTAEALGLTPEEFFAQLHAGKSLSEIAEEQNVELEAVRDAVSASQAEARKQAIEQAVKDERMSQEQADWMLEGLEKGFFPKGRGFRRQRFGHRCGGWGKGPGPEGE